MRLDAKTSSGASARSLEHPIALPSNGAVKAKALLPKSPAPCPPGASALTPGYKEYRGVVVVLD